MAPTGRVGRRRRARWRGGSENKNRARKRRASTDDDHYCAAFAFCFGSEDEPGVVRTKKAYRWRTGRDPSERFAIGGVDEIVARVAEFVDTGVSKFILRPAADGSADFLDQ